MTIIRTDARKLGLCIVHIVRTQRCGYQFRRYSPRQSIILGVQFRKVLHGIEGIDRDRTRQTVPLEPERLQGRRPASQGEGSGGDRARQRIDRDVERDKARQGAK